jgi:hypothetical protein
MWEEKPTRTRAHNSSLDTPTEQNVSEPNKNSKDAKTNITFFYL